VDERPAALPLPRALAARLLLQDAEREDHGEHREHDPYRGPPAGTRAQVPAGGPADGFAGGGDQGVVPAGQYRRRRPGVIVPDRPRVYGGDVLYDTGRPPNGLGPWVWVG